MEMRRRNSQIKSSFTLVIFPFVNFIIIIILLFHYIIIF